MRRTMAGLGVLTVLLALSTPAITAAVPHLPGSKCPKVGGQALAGKTPVKCVKIGKKLIWQSVKKMTPSAKPTPQPSSIITSAPAEISVNASQWSWQFKYVKVGTSTLVSDPSAQPPVLYLPLGEPVRFTLISNDVSHGFWIPGLLIDVRITAGSGNHLEFTAEKLGTFPGRCNVVCGREHTSMTFIAKVVTPAEYQSYISTLQVH